MLEQNHFDLNDNVLLQLSHKPSNLGETYYINFFPDQAHLPVTFIGTQDENLSSTLENLIKDEEIIVMDLEWDPDFGGKKHPIALFQVGTSKGALIIKNEGNKSPVMEEFLKTHIFYMKGTVCDIKKLEQYLGSRDSLKIIDVENQYLRPRGLSCNFDKMVQTYAGKPTASFKSKKVSLSRWSRPLNLRQICYAAFDVVSLYNCIPNMLGLTSEPMVMKKVKKAKTDEKSQPQPNFTSTDDNNSYNQNCIITTFDKMPIFENYPPISVGYTSFSYPKLSLLLDLFVKDEEAIALVPHYYPQGNQYLTVCAIATTKGVLIISNEDKFIPPFFEEFLLRNQIYMKNTLETDFITSLLNRPAEGIINVKAKFILPKKIEAKYKQIYQKFANLEANPNCVTEVKYNSDWIGNLDYAQKAQLAYEAYGLALSVPNIIKEPLPEPNAEFNMPSDESSSGSL